MRTPTKTCMHPRCGVPAKYTVAPGRESRDACGRHLAWAVDSVGTPGGADTTVRLLP